MRTTKAHFEYFQKRVRYWYKRYGLAGWELHFQHDEIGQCYSRIHVNMVNRLITIALNFDWANPDIYPLNQTGLDACAKHEVIHLLLGPMSKLMHARFVTPDELCAAEETLVRRLEELL